MSESKKTKLLKDRYEIRKVLDEGGMGRVFLAYDHEVGREVALKTVRKTKTSGTDFDQIKKRFKKEANVAGNLNHPNIVVIYDVFEYGNLPFIAMEFLKGSTLAAYIKLKGKLTLSETIEIIKPIAEALDFAHSHGVIHRDIKPANIMLLSSGIIKIMDFGISKAILSSTITEEGYLLGTLPYIPPEQFSNESIDYRGDIYSFGVTIFEMLTGVVPFDDTNFPVLVTLKMEVAPPSILSVNPNLPRQLESVIEKCLAKEPGKRFNTCAEIVRRLETINQKILEEKDTQLLKQPMHPPQTSESSHTVEKEPPAQVTSGQKPNRPSIPQDSDKLTRISTPRKPDSSSPRPPQRIEEHPPRKASQPQSFWATHRKAMIWITVCFVVLVGTALALTMFRSEGLLSQRPQELTPESRAVHGNDDNQLKPIPDAGSRQLESLVPTVVSPETVTPLTQPTPKIVKADDLPTPVDMKTGGVHLPEKERARATEIAATERAHKTPQSEPSSLSGSKSVTFQGIPMVNIEPGEFMMGAPANEEGSNKDERPEHTVTMTQGFWMSKTEVTQKQWKSIFGAQNNPSSFPRDSNPVERVSWYDCIAFCNRLSQRAKATPCYYMDEGYSKVFDGTPPIDKGVVFWKRDANGFRLPTEAEWEFACRAGTTTRFCSGNTEAELKSVAWFWITTNYTHTFPVATKNPNAWGLYDMHGNVWEWCWDWYDSYSMLPQVNPIGPLRGTQNVQRGGCWDIHAKECRSACRNMRAPNHRNRGLGFRVVK